MEWTEKALREAKGRVQQKLLEAHLDAYRFLSPEPEEAGEFVRSILVVLFPYYAGNYAEDANLSLYCRGMDYHAVVPKYLNPIGEAAKELLGENFAYAAYADTGPLRDRYLALRAGLGVIGRNQMLIHPEYGSYFFIGYMTFSAPFAADELPEDAKERVRRSLGSAALAAAGEGGQELSAGQAGRAAELGCLNCGLCVRSCPGGAMLKDGGFLAERCRSGITQKKGELSEEELVILKKDTMIFGCDICQTVCPMNRNVKLSQIPEFTENRIDKLTAPDLEGLSNRTFKEKYPERAFTWRGPEVLRRNLRILAD